LLKNTNSIIAGVDEAGRGAIAGPVVAAAVILTSDVPIDILKDSKTLTKEKRRDAFDIIMATTPYIGIGVLSHRYIDRINILQATMIAMKNAILQLKKKPGLVLIDGNKAPELKNYNLETIIKGDQKIPAISAASIIAKVTRDTIMEKADIKFPEYGFKIHKGYGTKTHYDALFKIGASPIHRLSFNLTKQNTLF
jgi:ribonuclease HII